MAVFVKILFRVCVIFTMVAVSIAAGLVWGPLSAMIAEPLVRRYGENSVPSLRIGHVDGSLFSGITLNGISLTSGDDTLLEADRLMIRPSWKELTHGALWISDLELGGVRVDAEDIAVLASRYGGHDGGSPGAAIKPIRVALRDITCDTPMYPIKIDEGLLTQDGSLSLSADLGGLPVQVDGHLVFDPLQALSFDVSVGSGRAFWHGKLTAPFDIKGELSSIKLDELMAVLPGLSAVSGDGDIEGRFNVMGSGEHLGAWGSISLKSGSVAGVPAEASASWGYKNGELYLKDAKANVLSADVDLKVSADLRPIPEGDRFIARGSVKGVSMKSLRQVLSLDVKLDGDNGLVDFWVSADQTGQTAGKVFARLPELKADGKQIVKGLRATALLLPGGGVSFDCTGEAFGAKLSGVSGEGVTSLSTVSDIVFTASGIDSALVAAAFPALAGAAPSGKLNVTLRGRNEAGDSDNTSFTVGIEASSQTLSLAGVKLDAVSANARYENGLITLNSLKARIGKAPLDLAGTFNMAASALRFDGAVKGLDPKSIPGLTGVTGLCDVTAAVRGTADRPEITAALTGRGNAVMDIPLQRVALSCTYADGRLTIPETALSFPGGSLSLRGSVALPPGGEPVADMACSLKNLDMKALSKHLGTDMSGRLSAGVTLSGPISAAAVSAAVTSDALSLLSADIRGLDLDVSGTTKEVKVRRLKANVDGGALEGKGDMTFGRNGRIQVDMTVDDLEIRSLLARYGIDAGVGGNLDGNLSLRGSLWRPELTLNVTSPLTIKETLLDRLSVTINSPAGGKFGMNASGRMGGLDLTLKAHMERGKERGEWGYAAESGLIDLDKLVSAKTPSMKGQLSGSAKLRITGRLSRRRGAESTPVNVTISVPSASFAGMKVDGLSVPIRVTGDKAEIRQGSGTAYDGKILIDADIDLPKKQWIAVTKISGLDVGKAAAPFLTQGGIVGSADIDVRAKGDYGALMMVFANGEFRSGEGYLHGFDALKRVTDDGTVSFQQVRGSFFWDGGDLWLNPGTQATAKPGDILYKYLSVNGSMGLKGKGLGLNFNGNFNVQALDMILGSLKGLFQLTTGSLTGGKQIIRQAVGKMIGFTERDFQDVSFQLKGSWKNLQLLNLQINKSIEEFMPIAASDYLPMQSESESDKKIQFHLKIPAGPGGDSGENAEDQFKKQLLDNLLDWTIPTNLP